MLQIGRNILSLIVSRIIAGVILFLVYTQLAQYLGPTVTGQYGLLAAYVTVFNFFIDLGMSQLVIKKISEDRAHAEKYLGNYFVIQTILAVVFVGIMNAVVFINDYPVDVKNALYMASLGLFLSTLSLPLRSVVSAFQRLTIMAGINFFNSLINASMMVLAIVFRQNLFFLSLISVAVGLFDLIVYSILVNKRYVRLKPAFDFQFWKQLILMNAPFIFLTFFSIYNRIDTLLLPKFRDFVETGYYTAAYKFWDVLAFLPAVVGVSLYPFFAEALSKNLKDYAKEGLETYSRYMIALAVPLSIGAFILAKPITLAFYGETFMPAANALWLLVLAVSLLIIYSPVNSLIISQMTKTAMKITGFNLFYNLAANIILLPRFGFVASAAITVGSEIIQLLAYTYVVNKKIIRYNFFRYFIKPLIAGGIMAVALILLAGRNVWLLIAVGALAYSVSLLLLKFFHRQDWDLFKAAVNIRKSVDVKTETV
ncbi:MAG: hypothetical protein A3H72_00555 [Candidatus Doudnabacteria bacterium RIFCSPLOWO2_02_FULL_48_8]|uniref:Uncharacterized protein n=1 Tax=Candidatus Doudnabacteria bacterium RIFCSPHIGHO2_01_FULL_46_24 TaxID=1817825 RepID=A0A1F5NU54_9BACT|nr:MAG: hypothetical protein A2720_01510 [Candidatus Doudnabacteria bacterium RIFCSPHIGHO2_01_FULL_46_24]OGE95582.1 MAG: hypothetical protein A3H72_00555 [Candidatus Doudnabacteria bacterium RIFCSPLOWO2_02_FULL_48_8]